MGWPLAFTAAIFTINKDQALADSTNQCVKNRCSKFLEQFFRNLIQTTLLVNQQFLRLGWSRSSARALAGCRADFDGGFGLIILSWRMVDGFANFTLE